MPCVELCVAVVGRIVADGAEHPAPARHSGRHHRAPVAHRALVGLRAQIARQIAALLRRLPRAQRPRQSLEQRLRLPRRGQFSLQLHFFLVYLKCLSPFHCPKHNPIPSNYNSVFHCNFIHLHIKLYSFQRKLFQVN